MDLEVRDPDDGSPVAVVPPAADPSGPSGWWTCELREHRARGDEATVTLAPQVAVQAGLAKGRLVTVPHAGRTLCLVVEQLLFESSAKGRAAGLCTVELRDPAMTPRRLMPDHSVPESHVVVSDDPGETAVKLYVDEFIGPSAAAELVWPLLAIEPDQGRGDSGTWQARFQDLEQFVSAICRQTGIGWRTVWDEGETEAVFEVYAGVALSRVLSVGEGTARSETWLDSLLGSRNVAHVAGDGELASRTLRMRFAGVEEPEGLARRETFVDARDTDSTATMDSRGDAALAESAVTDTVEVEPVDQDGWRYGVDYDLGDEVEFRSLFRAGDVPLRIEEVTSSWDGSLVPARRVTVGRPWPEVDVEELGGARYV